MASSRFGLGRKLVSFFVFLSPFVYSHLICAGLSPSSVRCLLVALSSVFKLAKFLSLLQKKAGRLFFVLIVFLLFAFLYRLCVSICLAVEAASAACKWRGTWPQMPAKDRISTDRTFCHRTQKKTDGNCQLAHVGDS